MNQQLDLNTLELAHSQIQESQHLQQQKDEIRSGSNQQTQIKFWNKQFHLDNVKYHQTLNSRLIDQIDLTNLTDIQNLTPAIRNIMDSKVEPEDFGEGKITYQQFYKIHQACISAFHHYQQLQQERTQTSQQLYHTFQKRKQKSLGLEQLKKQHLQKQQQNMDKIKQLQWKINDLKKQTENLGKYKCQYCHKLFSKKPEFQHHIKKEHQELVQEVIRQRQIQQELNHPEVIKKKSQIEQEAIEALKQLGEQVDDLPNSHKDKEEELVTRIAKIMNKNINIKIQRQLDMLEQERQENRNNKEEQRNVTKQQLQVVQEAFEKFDQELEVIKTYQHNLVDDQYLSRQQLLEYQKEQDRLLKEKKDFIEFRTLEMHKQGLKQKQLDRNIEEQISYGGQSDLVDNKQSWFFDSGLKPQNRSFEQLQKSGLGEFLKPDPGTYEPIILENSQESNHYSNSVSKEFTQEFEQSVTITSQNLPQEQQLDMMSQGEREEYEKNLEIKRKEELKEQQKLQIQQNLGELEDDIDSQADDIQEYVDRDRFFERNNPYKLLIPENKQQIQREKETQYQQSRDINMQHIQNDLNPIQRQEGLYNNIQKEKQNLVVLKMELDQIKKSLEKQEDQRLLQDKKSKVAQILHCKNRIQELETDLQKQKKQTLKEQKKNKPDQLDVKNNQHQIVQQYLEGYEDGKTYDNLASKDPHDLNELLYKIQSQYRNEIQPQSTSYRYQGNKQE